MEIGMYIHIPFCLSKCYYCDFASYANYSAKYKEYIEALEQEIISYSKQINDKHIVKTIFIGGGTPSVLPPILLEKLLLSINENFNLSNNIEFTMEANPGTLSKEKLEIIKKYGVNRISLGVQAFQNRLLKSIGRTHSVEDVIQCYNLCRDTGFNNINMDLIFALPKQTQKDWEETLDKVIQLSPEHISAYSLIIEEGTKFGDLYNIGKLEIFDEALEREMYSYAKQYLSNHGYKQYEISNFAKEGMESSHNIDCWKAKEYIGLGLGAHSYYDGYRYNNTYDMDSYLLNSNTLDLIHENKKYVDLKSKIEEYMFLGLRLTSGININDFHEKFGMSINKVYKNVVKQNLNNKLLSLEDNQLFLTELGKDLSNRVFASFLLD